MNSEREKRVDCFVNSQKLLQNCNQESKVITDGMYANFGISIWFELVRGIINHYHRLD